MAIWLVRPPRAQRIETIEVGDLTLRVTSIVLSEVDVELLLGDPATACFAPGGNLGGLPFAEVAARVAVTLARQGDAYLVHMAVVAAATQGRYAEMVSALERRSGWRSLNCKVFEFAPGTDPTRPKARLETSPGRSPGLGVRVH
ncbi:MAG: hypothetical protein HYV07_02870 [Deltaproteobacteria bacterium]|nr:hypothetical protein [Deltaproteobacteria bacterium]